MAAHPSVPDSLQTAEPKADEGARSDPEDGETGAALVDAGRGGAPAAAGLLGEASAARQHHVGVAAAAAEQKGRPRLQGQGVLTVRAPREEARQRGRPRIQVSCSHSFVLSSGSLLNDLSGGLFINENVDSRIAFSASIQPSRNGGRRAF